MIPKEICAFLEGATIAMGGSRDRDLKPHAHRISGWMVGEDGETLTCLIAEKFTSELSESLEDNRQFALTVCEVPSHETYQFKGVWAGSRPVNPADLAVYERYRGRFAERVSQMLGFPEERARAYVPQPSMALSFKVREIFLQTPGPDAGRRLVPPEGS